MYCDECVKEMLAAGYGFRTEGEAWRATTAEG